MRAGTSGADYFLAGLYAGAGVRVKEGMATVRQCHTVLPMPSTHTHACVGGCERQRGIVSFGVAE